MPPDAHPSLSRSMATENRRQPASRTQNARPLSPLPENASAIHRWKIFPFRTGRQGESAFLLSPRSGAQPPPRKTTSPPMAAFPTWQRRCFRRQYAPRQRPSFHAKVPDANGNPQRALLPSNMPRHGSGPASPVNAPGMRSGSQRSICAWRHAFPYIISLRHRRVNASLPKPRRLQKWRPRSWEFGNCFVQSPAGRRSPGRHSKALPGPPQ